MLVPLLSRGCGTVERPHAGEMSEVWTAGLGAGVNQRRPPIAPKLRWLEAHPDLWRDLPDEWLPEESFVRTILTHLREKMTDAGLYSENSHSGDVEMSIFKTVLTLRRQQARP